jgi:signal transduction histidine kinase
MLIGESDLALLQNQRLAILATSCHPAWLWSVDGALLWANASGAAAFITAKAPNMPSPRRPDSDSSADQVRQLAANLPHGGQARFERLRGFGARLGKPLMCACSLLTLEDGSRAVLIAALEATGPSLSFKERVRLIVPDGAEAVAAFAPDGSLLHANAAARQWLGDATALPALGLEAFAASALASGNATGAAHLRHGHVDVTALRLGEDEWRVLLFVLRPQPRQPATTAGAHDGSEPDQIPDSMRDRSPAWQVDGVADAERRHPLRFVWQMDADGRFVIGSDEFIELVGPRAIAACGRLWSEIAAELKLDPDDQVAQAVARRGTWSGIQISWPIEEMKERIEIELSGLPVFNRDRTFGGFRGFGVCRDVDCINRLSRARLMRPIGFASAPEPATEISAAIGAEPRAATEQGDVGAEAAPETVPPQQADRAEARAVQSEPVELGFSPAANVVPFRAGLSPLSNAPSLSPVERIAFRELAEELTARLRGPAENGAAEAPLAATGAAMSGGHKAAIAAGIAAIAAAPDSDAPPQTSTAYLALLDRVPAGILIYRGDDLLYGNRHFLEMSGYPSIEALAGAGGLGALFAAAGTGEGALIDNGAAQKLSIVTRHGEKLPVEGKLFSVPWDGASALALILRNGQAEERQRAMQLALDAAQTELGALKANVDRAAGRAEENAAAVKADFIARVSHEIRTPLNSIIGFAEVLMAERFGPIGNERYRDYLKDMHAAGTHLVSMLNDLVDLSKIETGRLDLAFTGVDLNDLIGQCVAVTQPQANRARIIIRSALTPGLPDVTADARTMRQIVLNLLGNAIKFTGPGGQVIVSTAMAGAGEVLMRVRDTGAGMKEADIETALDPFHKNKTAAGWGSGGAGLALPLTKALAEANHARFSLQSAPNAGTLVELAFPSSRLAAR